MRADSGIAPTLVARDLERLRGFVETQWRAQDVPRQIAFDDFADGEYDAVINCVGIGDPAKLAAGTSDSILELTERFDRLALDYLARFPQTRYVSFSSGAAYGGTFDEPASQATPLASQADGPSAGDSYGAVKAATEAKHRALADLAIVDLRLFGLYSRFIDPRAHYFMNDVFDAIAAKKRLRVGPGEMWRDYVSPGDLWRLVASVLRAKPRNDVFDIYSAAPASKFEILGDFAQRYGLAYDVDEGLDAASPTGTKRRYYSANRRAQELGFVPEDTSLDTLRAETDARLEELEEQHGD